MPATCDAVVVGAGPAGLATAACLARNGVHAVVLEAGPSLGTSWRNTYDRLHLHTVKEHSSLPGLPFPADVPRYPSRHDVVQYLESYAARFNIAPRLNTAVREIRADENGFVIEAAAECLRAKVVVVATGLNRVPNPEALADQSIFEGAIVRAADYRTGAEYAGRRALVVGAGNSGAEIALDLAEHGVPVALAVRTPVNVVRRDFLGIPAQLTTIRLRRLPRPMLDRVGRWISRAAFGDLTRYGLPPAALGPVSSIVLRGRIPIIDVGTVDAIKRGRIAVKPAVARLTRTGAVFADRTEAPYDVVVMATGYMPDLSGIVKIPGVLDTNGRPLAWSAAPRHRGLYFVGFENVATGLLREIGLQAQAVARDLIGR
jgi:indole-3-pyruvate monooxygenase